jgi:NADH-quinone oxidoreductase subunit H
MRVGGWHGWSQSLADGMKLIAKEDFVPPQGDGPLFRLAPYLAMVPSLAAFIALPFGAMWVFRDLDVALLFILAMMGIEVVSVILAGWASNNKWSLFGGMREACQVVSYEIPMGMSLLIPVMVAGSLRFTDIAAPQAGGWFTWYVFHSPFTFVAAVTYFIASLASVKRAPFDLPEGESELVAGFHTEYSGFRWSLFFFAEYAAMFVVSGLLVILFLGAWHAPWAAPERFAEAQTFWGRVVYGTFFSGPLIFIFKCSLLLYLQMWLRWTLPRIRIDQVLYACIQVMLPLVMVVLLGSTFWELMAMQGWTWFDVLAAIVRYGLGAIGLVLAGGILYVAFHGFSRRRALVGRLGVDLLPGA